MKENQYIVFISGPALRLSPEVRFLHHDLGAPNSIEGSILGMTSPLRIAPAFLGTQFGPWSRMTVGSSTLIAFSSLWTR